MPAPLHVANGQVTARKLAEGGVVGTILSHDDVLLDGPLPAGEAVPPSAEWTQRAAWMQREHGADPATYVDDLRRLASVMAAHDGAVVLWSDHGCTHCAVNLLWLLRLPVAGTRMLAAPASGPRLGERAPHDVAQVVPVAVAPEQVAWAGRAWDAACAGPAALRGFLLRETPGWPSLAADLKPYADLPGVVDAALERWLEWQPLTLGEMMERLGKDPKVKGLGMGDASLLVRLRSLEVARKVRQDAGRWRLV